MKFTFDEYTSSGISGVPASAQKMTLSSTVVGEGGFGKVIEVKSIDGRAPAEPLVAKLFLQGPAAAAGYKTISRLQQGLKAAENAAIFDLRKNYQALEAIPLATFLTKDKKGNTVHGYLSSNLFASGYEPYDDILADKKGAKSRYSKLGFAERLSLCDQLVKAFSLFQNINFVHADFKAEALFVDIKRARIAVIDLDSGAVMDKPNERPTTWGTQQSWLAPEVRKQVNAGIAKGGHNGRVKVKVSIASDIWSVTVALHTLIYSIEPYAGFSEVSERSLALLSRATTYSPIPSGYPYSSPARKTVDDFIAKINQGLPEGLPPAFATTFTSGVVDEQRRTSYGQWRLVLQAAATPPSITTFTIDRTFVDDKKPVRLNWDVKDATLVTLDGVAVAPRGAKDITVRSDQEFVLVAKSPFGNQRSLLSVTTAIEQPEILSFTSSLDSDLLRRIESFKLYWQVNKAHEIRISPSLGVQIGTQCTVAGIRRQTTFILTATSWFGQETSSRITIDVDQTPPKIRAFRVDTAIRLDVDTPVRLQWAVSGAEKIEISEGVGTVGEVGTIGVDPRRKTRYRLTAESCFGILSSATAVVDVSQKRPIIDYFRASTCFVHQQKAVTFVWKVREAETVNLIHPDQGPIALTNEDTGQFLLTDGRSIQLIATSVFGIESRAFVRFLSSPALPSIPEFSCLPVSDGATPTELELRWRVNSADSVVIAPTLGSVANTGRMRIDPTTPTSYTLTASTKTGAHSTRHVLAIPTDRPPAILKFSCSSLVALVGQEVKISWNITGAAHLALSPFGELTEHTGERVFIAAQTETFQLRAFNRAGTLTQRNITLRVLKVPILERTIKLFTRQ